MSTYLDVLKWNWNHRLLSNCQKMPTCGLSAVLSDNSRVCNRPWHKHLGESVPMMTAAGCRCRWQGGGAGGRYTCWQTVLQQQQRRRRRRQPRVAPPRPWQDKNIPEGVCLLSAAAAPRSFSWLRRPSPPAAFLTPCATWGSIYLPESAYLFSTIYFPPDTGALLMDRHVAAFIAYLYAAALLVNEVRKYGTK